MSPDYDPITQIGNAKRAVMGWFGDEEPPPPVVVPPPAEGRPIPNLGTVPPPPVVTTGERQQRQKAMEALQADRAAAAKADEALRARTASAETAPTQSPVPPAPVTSTPLLPPSASGSSSPATAAPPSAAPAAPAAPTSSSSSSSSPSPSVAAEATASTPPPRPNSLPPELLSSTPVGAAPAPVIELPSLPPALARKASAAAGLLTTSEPHGAVSFAAGASELSAAARNTLDAAVASALQNDGRVRLVPAQVDEVAAPNLVAQRTKELRAELTGTGLPADRITIGDLGGQRVDVYNVFVDY